LVPYATTAVTTAISAVGPWIGDTLYSLANLPAEANDETRAVGFPVAQESDDSVATMLLTVFSVAGIAYVGSKACDKIFSYFSVDDKKLDVGSEFPEILSDDSAHRPFSGILLSNAFLDTRAPSAFLGAANVRFTMPDASRDPFMLDDVKPLQGEPQLQHIISAMSEARKFHAIQPLDKPRLEGERAEARNALAAIEYFK
jgi:hypothetical protein